MQHILYEEMMLADIASATMDLPKSVSFTAIRKIELVVPSRRHGLRRIIDNAAANAGFTPVAASGDGYLAGHLRIGCFDADGNDPAGNCTAQSS
jgi:hypothetical protein